MARNDGTKVRKRVAQNRKGVALEERGEPQTGSLKAVLRRKLSAPKEGVRLFLRPELAPETEHLERLERWMPTSKLPPCRLVWIGDLVDWGGWLHVAALVGPLISHEEAFKAVLLALKWLGNASVARLLSELTEYGSSEPSATYGQPVPIRIPPRTRGGSTFGSVRRIW